MRFLNAAKASLHTSDVNLITEIGGCLRVCVHKTARSGAACRLVFHKKETSAGRVAAGLYT